MNDVIAYLSQNLRTPNPGFNPGFTPLPFYITNAGGEPRVKSGVWHPEMWAKNGRKSMGLLQLFGHVVVLRTRSQHDHLSQHQIYSNRVPVLI
jgi:hypothetical protein